MPVSNETTLAALLERNSELFATYGAWANAQVMLLAGTIDDPDSFNAEGGKTGALGYYPVENVNGQIIYVPSLARLQVIAAGGGDLSGIEALLSATIEAKDEAQAAAAAAFGGLPYAATIAQGLIDHPTTGAQFQVLASDKTYSVAYRNDGGSAVEVNRLPSLAAVQSIPTTAQFSDIKQQVDTLTSDPANAVTSFGVSASAVQPIVNANVTRGFNARKSYLSFPKQMAAANVDSRTELTMEFPSHWHTAYFDLWLINLSASTGNVSVGVSILPFTDGTNIDNGGSSGLTSVAAMPAALLTAKRVRVGPLPVTPGMLHTVAINRQGTSGSDTLGNAVGLFHLQAVKAS